MRKTLIPLVMTALTVAVMLYQGLTGDPALAPAPAVRLGELDGYVSKVVEPSESELATLPRDTHFDKRIYKADDGLEVSVSLLIGGRSKSSIHRPELCLPSQGFQMTSPRTRIIGGTSWRLVTLFKGEAAPMSFAYTFFNQEGYRTSSHVRRIFRDVWDRSICGRIDRWAMVTVFSPGADEVRFRGFLLKLEGMLKQ